MDVSSVLVADLQAPEAVEPGERSFDHPAVASQAVLGLDTTAGDAGDDPALAQGQTEVTVVVTLVGMELVRSATGVSPKSDPIDLDWRVTFPGKKPPCDAPVSVRLDTGAPARRSFPNCAGKMPGMPDPVVLTYSGSYAVSPVPR